MPDLQATQTSSPLVWRQLQLRLMLRFCRLPLHLEMSLKSSSPSPQSQHKLLRRLSQLLQMRQMASPPPVVE